VRETIITYRLEFITLSASVRTFSALQGLGMNRTWQEALSRFASRGASDVSTVFIQDHLSRAIRTRSAPRISHYIDYEDRNQSALDLSLRPNHKLQCRSKGDLAAGPVKHPAFMRGCSERIEEDQRSSCLDYSHWAPLERLNCRIGGRT
jgi:hypothetical protein